MTANQVMRLKISERVPLRYKLVLLNIAHSRMEAWIWL